MTEQAKEREAPLPCPFCGASLVFKPLRHGDDYYAHPKNECTLAGDLFIADPFTVFDSTDAITAWNRRASPPVQGEDEPARNVTEQEDKWLRNAATRSATLVDEGKLVPPAQESAGVTSDNEALVLAIDAHLDGWKSATFSWQDDPDPEIAERNKAAAIQAHAAECLRRIRFALAAAAPAPTPSDEALPEVIDHRLSVWLTMDKELHPATVNLVVRFARALAAKLADAETKYGYSDGWRDSGWMDECRAKLLEHVAKGDPRDVAAYCAFLWHHGESTTAPSPVAGEGANEIRLPESQIRALMVIANRWAGPDEADRRTDYLETALRALRVAAPYATSQADGAATGCEYPKCECPIVGLNPQCGKHTGHYKSGVADGAAAAKPVDEALAALRELVRVKNDRDNHWPLSEWLITWNNAWFRARNAVNGLSLGSPAAKPVRKESRPLGCALAMRVMQSELYRGLDDAERADCDELVQRNLEWFKGDVPQEPSDAKDAK